MEIFYSFIPNLTKKNKNELHHSAGRYILNYAAKNIYKINNTEIGILNGKPKFKFSDKKFSISHSGEIAAVCFSDFEVGLDIEYIKDRDYISIANRMNFKLNKQTLDEFYEIWTQYEADYKLGCNAKSHKTKKILSDYMLTVASEEEIKDIIFKEIIIN